MRLSATRGLFVSFEGGETVGKTTQVKRLVAELLAAGHDVVQTREPGGTPLGEMLRTDILSGRYADDPNGEARAFAAVRAMHVDRVIRPAVEAGSIVVCDRFVDSTRALQIESGADPDLVEHLIDLACGSTIPDLTVVLSIPDDLLMSRLGDKKGRDAIEERGPAYHLAVMGRFRRIAASDPDRCVLVDASGSIEEVAGKVRSVVEDRLSRIGLSLVA